MPIAFDDSRQTSKSVSGFTRRWRPSRCRIECCVHGFKRRREGRSSAVNDAATTSRIRRSLESPVDLPTTSTGNDCRPDSLPSREISGMVLLFYHYVVMTMLRGLVVEINDVVSVVRGHLFTLLSRNSRRCRPSPAHTSQNHQAIYRGSSCLQNFPSAHRTTSVVRLAATTLNLIPSDTLTDVDCSAGVATWLAEAST